MGIGRSDARIEDVTLDIIWYGHSCFRLSERGMASVVTDPFGEGIGLPAPKLKADIVTVSHHSAGHSALDAVKGAQIIIDSPGEYEVGGVFVTGIAMHYIDDQVARRNVGYLFDFGNDMNALHLGDLSHVPDQSTIKELGEVTVLFVPVGGGNGLKAAMAAEVITLIEPRYIVPMHYALPNLTFELEPVEKFLKAMGVSKVQEEDTLRITGALPEQPQVVLLNPQFKMS